MILIPHKTVAEILGLQNASFRNVIKCSKYDRPKVYRVFGNQIFYEFSDIGRWVAQQRPLSHQRFIWRIETMIQKGELCSNIEQGK